MTRYVILECETNFFDGAPWRHDGAHFGQCVGIIDVDHRGGRRQASQVERVMQDLIRRVVNGRRPIDALVPAGFNTGGTIVDFWMRRTEARHPELKLWGIAASNPSPLFAYAAVEIGAPVEAEPDYDREASVVFGAPPL